MIRLAIAAPESDAAQTLAFEGPVLVGRGAQCDAVLSSRGISNAHCRISEVPGLAGAYMLEDLRSTYGTLVNGQPIRKPVVLSERDVVTVGGHRLVVIGAGGVAGAQARLSAPAPQISMTASTASHAALSQSVAPPPSPAAFSPEAPWIDQYTHFDRLARGWQEAGRPQRGLLTGGDIGIAEAWLAAGARQRPSPEAIHQEFIVHSRRALGRRTRRGVLAAVAVLGLAGLVALGIRYRGPLQALLTDEDLPGLPTPLAVEHGAQDPGTPAERGRDLNALTQALHAVADPEDRLLIAAGIAAEGAGRVGGLTGGPDLVLYGVAQHAASQSGELVLRDHQQPVAAVAIGPTGRWVASGGADNSARLYDLWSSAPLVPTTLRGHLGTVTAVAISPDGTTLVTASEDASVRRWDLTADEPGATGVNLQGHALAVARVAWHGDSKYLASADVGGTVIAWDLTAPDPAESAHKRVLHDATITDLAFFEDYLYSTSDDRSARRLTLDEAGRLTDPVRFAAHLGGITSLALTADGRILATAGTDGEVLLWEPDGPSKQGKRRGSTPRGKPFATLSGHDQSVNDLAFSGDGSQLVTASDDDTLRVWNAAAKDPSVGSVVLSGHTGDITSVKIVGDGTKAVSAAIDNTLRVWDLAKSDRIVDTYVLSGHEGPVNAVAVAPDRLWAASGSDDGTVRVWDLLSRTPGRGAKLYRVTAGPVFDVALSRLGDRAVTVGAGGAAAVWDLNDDAVMPRPTPLAGLSGLVNATAIDPQARYAATGGDNGDITLWPLTQADPSRGKRTLTGHQGAVNALGFSPDGRTLLSVSSDRTVRAWPVDAPQDPTTHAAPHEVWTGHADEVYLLAVSPRGEYAFTGGASGQILRWPLAEGSRGTAGALTGHEGRLHALVVSGDGTRLASASADRKARLWDVHRGTSQFVLRGHDEPVTAVAFSSRGTLATGGEDAKILIWALESAHPDEAPKPLSGHEQTIEALAYTADGARLLSASRDGTLRLWHPETGESTQLVGHDGVVNGVVVDPHGHFALSTSFDGTARLWPLDATTLARIACEAVGRPVSEASWAQFFAPNPPPRLCQAPQPGRPRIRPTLGRD